MGFAPRTPAPGPITFRLRLVGIYPVLADSEPDPKFRVGFAPPQTCPRANLFTPPGVKPYPVLEASDGVGFEPTVGLPLLLISSQVH